MSELWETIIQFSYDVMNAFFLVLKTAIAWFFGIFFDLIATAIESIPRPEFMDHQIVEYIHPDILYFLGVTDFATCLAIVGGGILFRFIRRIVTLGIW